MDFEYTPEQEAFRTEVRDWLRANLPPELCVDDAMDERVASTREIFEKRRLWQAKLNAAGYAGLAWPEEYGARAAAAGLFGSSVARADHDVLGHRRTEEILYPAHPERRRYLVPGLF